MYIDIVIPNGNEKQFVEMAQKLGYSGICFAYEMDKFKEQSTNFPSLSNIKVKIYFAIITTAKNVQKAKNITDLVIIHEAENIREAAEKHRPDLIIGMEEQKKRDFMHQRNAGINQVLCTIANEKKIHFGICLSAVMENRGRHVILGRIMQNIRLYKKYKNNIVFASFAKNPYDMRSPKDLTSFLIVLGMDSKAAKNTLREAFNIIERNRKIKNKLIISDGVEVVS